MSFDMFNEYSDNNNNQFTLESGTLAGAPPERAAANTAEKYIPEIELIDSVAMVDDFHKFLDQQLQSEAEKPKLESKYDTAGTSKAVEAALAHDKPMVVHIGAEWCPPCKNMERNVWPGIEKDNKGKAAFLHIDSDKVTEKGEGGALAKDLMKDVEDLPTIRIVKPYKTADGKIEFKTLDERVGGMDTKAVQQMIDKYFEKQGKR